MKYKSKATMVALEALIALALAFAVVFTVHAIARAQSRETPVYGPDGKYQGSVFDYGRTQTYTDRNGQFNGSAVNNGNGTTSFFNRNGQFNGSAGSSIDRAFNFNGGRR
jgi:hypothetical protein